MAKIFAFVCLLVLVMDAAAGILGMEAQLALNKACFHSHLPSPSPQEKMVSYRFLSESMFEFRAH